MDNHIKVELELIRFGFKADIYRTNNRLTKILGKNCL